MGNVESWGTKSNKIKKMKLTLIKVIITGLNERLVPVAVALGALVLLVLILFIV